MKSSCPPSTPVDFVSPTCPVFSCLFGAGGPGFLVRGNGLLVTEAGGGGGGGGRGGARSPVLLLKEGGGGGTKSGGGS